jgi:hypothetical protein
MIKGDFSNAGVDTFDASKQYIGIRLQQGVPLLDRDWNELEDIRRYFERMLRRHYIGQGVPGADGFAISAPRDGRPNDLLIGPGRCMVDGYDVYNPLPLLYSAQAHERALSTPQEDEVLFVYVSPRLARVDATEDPDLLNSQDIHLETCLRDKLSWVVGVSRAPSRPPAGSALLAEVRRPGGEAAITEDMILDRRRRHLNLAAAVDDIQGLRKQAAELAETVADIQLDIEGIKKQLGKLLWDVSLTSSQDQALFGEKILLTASVMDGNQHPVRGAHLAFSVDWGVLDPATVVTDEQGKAVVELVGLKSETPPPKSEIAVMQDVVYKVKLAMFKNPGTIQYQKIRFKSPEMELVSKYSPENAWLDLSRNLPTGPIVALPAHRTVTVTVHAKEGSGAIVRGVGNLQVSFGLWVRDWAKTKVWDIVSKVGVVAQMTDIMRKGVKDGSFDPDAVTSMLPEAMERIQTDVLNSFKASTLLDGGDFEDEAPKTGMIGQVIAQEATAAVGYNTNHAVTRQLKTFVDEGVQVDVPKAKTRIVQESSKISAGFAQNQKQAFSSAGRFTS